jgi:UDP-galactopyranose mutase
MNLLSSSEASNFINTADLLIVGAGFFGSTIARLAADAGFRTLVIDKRPHIGGNSWSEKDSRTGVEVHKYGTHIFHTSSREVWNFVNRFSEFNNYQHQVFTKSEGEILQLPVNLSTINSVFGQTYSPDEARQLLAEKTRDFQGFRDDNLEGRALASVGRDIYERIFKGYTQKQWQTEPSQLPAEVISRLPIRYNYNPRYFNDVFEGMPIEGYGNLFRKMLDHENIAVALNVDFFEFRDTFDPHIPTVYTGPVDKYFGYSEGKLSWRTIDFEWEWHEYEDHQGCAVMNYADVEVPYTRVHEFHHLHPESQKNVRGTVLAKEYSRPSRDSDDEPYYPINTPRDREILLKYRNLTKSESGVVFGGRLGTYQYLDMHMAIASAFSIYRSDITPLLEKR